MNKTLNIVLKIFAMFGAAWAMTLFASGEHAQAAYWIGLSCYLKLLTLADEVRG